MLYSMENNPQVCVCLCCVGCVASTSQPTFRFLHLVAATQQGGCCGEIAVQNTRFWHPLDAAQHFEYKVSHVMDKAMESAFGYISVLPGAFCMYRWVAVRGEPLNAYFRLEEDGRQAHHPTHVTRATAAIVLTLVLCRAGFKLSPFTANMYLAEDRVTACGACMQCSTVNEGYTERTNTSCVYTVWRCRCCALRWLQNMTWTGRCITSPVPSPTQTRPSHWYGCYSTSTAVSLVQQLTPLRFNTTQVELIKQVNASLSALTCARTCHTARAHTRTTSQPLPPSLAAPSMAEWLLLLPPLLPRTLFLGPLQLCPQPWSRGSPMRPVHVSGAVQCSAVQ